MNDIIEKKKGEKILTNSYVIHSKSFVPLYGSIRNSKVKRVNVSPRNSYQISVYFENDDYPNQYLIFNNYRQVNLIDDKNSKSTVGCSEFLPFSNIEFNRLDNIVSPKDLKLPSESMLIPNIPEITEIASFPLHSKVTSVKKNTVVLSIPTKSEDNKCSKVNNIKNLS